MYPCDSMTLYDPFLFLFSCITLTLTLSPLIPSPQIAHIFTYHIPHHKLCSIITLIFISLQFFFLFISFCISFILLFIYSLYYILNFDGLSWMLNYWFCFLFVLKINYSSCFRFFFKLLSLFSFDHLFGRSVIHVSTNKNTKEYYPWAWFCKLGPSLTT